jgi:hypothetical protein
VRGEPRGRPEAVEGELVPQVPASRRRMPMSARPEAYAREGVRHASHIDTEVVRRQVPHGDDLRPHLRGSG